MCVCVCVCVCTELQANHSTPPGDRSKQKSPSHPCHGQVSFPFSRLLPACPWPEIRAQPLGFMASYLLAWPETPGQGTPGAGIPEPVATLGSTGVLLDKELGQSLYIYLELQKVLRGKRMAQLHLGKETPGFSNTPI